MLETSAQTTTESSLLLWMLAAAVAMFAAYVALGWVRESQRHPAWRHSWKGLLYAAGSMGAGISGCMVLALSAEPLTFPLGYPGWQALGLWLASMALCLPVCAWLIRSQGLVAKMGSALLLAAAAGFIQSAWLKAVGFRPGIIWRPEFLVASGLVLTVGLVFALLMAYSHATRHGRRRRLWRMAGAALTGLALIAGQEIMMAGAGLLAQLSSVYRNQVPASWLCLLSGVVVPLVLAIMTVNLRLKQQQRRRQGASKKSRASSSFGASRQSEPGPVSLQSRVSESAAMASRRRRGATGMTPQGGAPSGVSSGKPPAEAPRPAVRFATADPPARTAARAGTPNFADTEIGPATDAEDAAPVVSPPRPGLKTGPKG